MTRSFACALTFIEVRVIIGVTGWDKYTEANRLELCGGAYPLADLVLQGQDLRRSGRPVCASVKSGMLLLKDGDLFDRGGRVSPFPGDRLLSCIHTKVVRPR